MHAAIARDGGVELNRLPNGASLRCTPRAGASASSASTPNWSPDPAGVAGRTGSAARRGELAAAPQPLRNQLRERFFRLLGRLGIDSGSVVR